MAIRRAVRNRRRSSTLIANPRRRNRRRKNKRRNYSLRRAVRNRRSTRKGGVRKTARRAYARRRNPKFDLTLGLPIIEVGIGAAAAIALKQVLGNLKFVTDMEKEDPTAMLPKALGPGLTFAAGFAGYTYGKGMIKKVSKYVALTALIMLIDDLAGAAIKKAVTPKPKTGGAYGYVDGLGYGDLGGTYLDIDGMGGIGGAYVSVPSTGFSANNFS